MSSLAAVQADGYYIDPSKFDPKRGKGSANAVTGTHALGARASRLKSEGILVVRFELPYDSQCAQCGTFISHGVRFNADKRRVGEYFTTPIWEFSMRCSSGCGCVFVIRTAPAEGDYDFISGVRRRVKDFIPDAEDGLGRAGGSLLLASAGPPRAGGAAMAAVERRAEAADAGAAAARELAALEGASARRYGAGSGALAAAAVGALRARAAAVARAEGEGAARGLRVALPAQRAGEEVADRLAAAAALQGRGAAEAGGGGSGGGGVVPPLLAAALRAAPLALGAGARGRAPGAAPRSGGSGSGGGCDAGGALPALALAVPAPSRFDAIVAAGRKRRAEEMGAARDAARAGAAAVAASLRAASGRAARHGAGPHVALAAGPPAPAGGGSLAAAPLRRLP
jgi:hypothetical protein